MFRDFHLLIQSGSVSNRTISKSTDYAMDRVASISDAKPIRVLLVDDLEDHLLLSAPILRRNGYDVATSSTSEDAQSKLHNIDIAVLDYHLGAGKFGTEVADTLRLQRPEVPII